MILRITPGMCWNYCFCIFEFFLMNFLHLSCSPYYNNSQMQISILKIFLNFKNLTVFTKRSWLHKLIKLCLIIIKIIYFVCYFFFYFYYLQLSYFFKVIWLFIVIFARLTQRYNYILLVKVILLRFVWK